MNALLEPIANFARQAMGYISDPLFVFQIVLIAALFFVSKVLARRIEPRLEQRVRAIKGRPGLLRVIAASLRRTHWIVFVLLLLAALLVLRGVTWPSRSWLIAIVLWLASVWTFVSIVSRIIRNRFLSRVVTWVVWIYAALLILNLDERMIAFLDRLALPVSGVQLSVWTVIETVFLFTVAVWTAAAIGRFIDRRVQASEDLAPSIRVLIGKIAKFSLIMLAAIAALSAVGFDLTAFTVFTGALGVGLGFGLQRVVSNFIAGVFILMDKSIKPGDTISLGETFGWIRELRARFVSVVTRDGREYLIPNEDFISQRVINWSFSDELVRIDVEFGVSYDSDPHQVTALAIQAAMGVGRVEATRQPVCWITAFGDSAIEFVLRFWIRDPQQGLTNVRGKVLLALWDTFQANGIRIPYPHREVFVHNAPPPVASGVPVADE